MWYELYAHQGAGKAHARRETQSEAEHRSGGRRGCPCVSVPPQVDQGRGVRGGQRGSRRRGRRCGESRSPLVHQAGARRTDRNRVHSASVARRGSRSAAKGHHHRRSRCVDLRGHGGRLSGVRARRGVREHAIEPTAWRRRTTRALQRDDPGSRSTPHQLRYPRERARVLRMGWDARADRCGMGLPRVRQRRPPVSVGIHASQRRCPCQPSPATR